MGGLCRSSVLALASLCLLVLASAEVDQIAYRGLLATQSTDRFGLTLREVREGPLLTQALAAGPEVLACEEVLLEGHQPPPGNSSVSVLPPQFSWLPSYREDCRRAEGVHARAKRAAPKRRTRHGKKKMHKLRKNRKKDHLAKGKKSRWTQTFITPGTKWCGPSNRAKHYADLGHSWEADRCCRTHDQCQSYILALSRSYSKVNMSPFTLSHCTCDRRFRTCLKLAGTTASNFVGKLFFNLMQTKCFVLKTERICTERNWLGKCQKTEMRRLAHIVDNMSY